MTLETKEILIDVKAKLTIDDDTAYTIMGLLELYCRDKNKTIKTYRCKNSEDAEYQVCFSMEDDDKSDLL